MANTPRTWVTGSFRDRESAERAYGTLSTRGYSKDDVNLMMSNETRNRLFGGKEVKTELGNKALEGAGVGGAVGGAVGAALTAIIAAGTTLAIPGLGLVIAGPLAGALAGAAAGGTTGGIIGALVGAGIPEERAKVYESDLKQGAIVLAVKPRSDEDADYFEREWQTQGEKVRR